MDFHSMKRRQLQDLCKKHNLPANKTNLQMAEALSLIFKDETKSVGSSGEIVSENSSGVAAKRVKKVRFCLEEREVEVVDLGSDLDVGVPKGARRKSILKPQSEIPQLSTTVKGNVENVEEGKGDIPVRVTRSRSRKSMVLEEALGVLSPLVKSKKSRVNKNSTEHACRNDNVDKGSRLLGNGVPENVEVIENDVAVRQSLRTRSTGGVSPERRDLRSTSSRKKADGNVDKETIMPMTRNLRSRKIDVVFEKTDARGIVSEGSENMDAFEDIGVAAKKSVKKKVVAKRKICCDETKISAAGQEDTGIMLGTGAEVPGKPFIHIDELTRGTVLEIKSTALVSDSEYLAKVEGNKRKSNYQKPSRRSQCIAPKTVSFAPNTEQKTESVVQTEKEDGRALQFEHPRNCNAHRRRHESSFLVSEDQNIFESKRKMVTKSEGHLRRSPRHKAGKKLEEPLLDEDVSSLDALAVEDSRPNKSEDIVHDNDKSPSNHLVNSDEGTQNCQSYCDGVGLTEERESIVTVVDNLSLPTFSDQMKEITNHTIPLVEEVINGISGEDVSLMHNESRESATTHEASENHDVCGSDTTIIESEENVPTDSEDKATTERNFACENEESFVEEGNMEKLESSVAEHDSVDCGASPIIDVAHDESHELTIESEQLLDGASPIIDVAHDDSDELTIEGEQLLDEAVTDVDLSCENGREISRDEGHAMKSAHFSPVNIAANGVESDRHTPESIKQLVFQEEGGVEVPQMVQSGRMSIQQFELQGNERYGNTPVNEHKVVTNTCVSDGGSDLEDHKGFVIDGGFVEHEAAHTLFKSCGVSAFDIVEASAKDRDSNEKGILLQCYGNTVSSSGDEDTTDISSQVHGENVDTLEADYVVNKAIEFTLDEHEIDLQVTEDKIIVEGEENSNAQEEKYASTEEPKVKSDELDAAMGNVSEFSWEKDINEDSLVSGTEPLAHKFHFSFNEENQMLEERIEDNCVSENIEELAGEGKQPKAFQPTGSSEMVDTDGAGQLELAHAIPKQIELFKPFQDCLPTEQCGTGVPTDDGRWNEVLFSQHAEPRHSWSATDDQNDLTHQREVTEQEESMQTMDEPVLDHLKMFQRNDDSYDMHDVHEYAVSGTPQNAVGARHVDGIECKEINNTSEVNSQHNESTAVDEAERHLVCQVKGTQNEAGTIIGEYMAIIEKDGLHEESGYKSVRKNTERDVSKLGNIFQISKKPEESTKPMVTELDDKEEERCSVGCVDNSTDSEDQERKENTVPVVYEPEPDEQSDLSPVLQQPCESVLAELSTINDFQLHSPFELRNSSRCAERKLDDHFVMVSGSIVCHHHRQSLEVLREAVLNDLENAERVSEADVADQSGNKNLAFEDVFENVQLSETIKLEIPGNISEEKQSDHIVEQNKGAMEQYGELKHTEKMVEEKVEAKAPSALGVKSNVENCSNNFDNDDSEEFSGSVYCSGYYEARGSIEDVGNHDISVVEPSSPFTSHVDELNNVKNAENEVILPQIYTLEVTDYEDNDGKVQDAMSVAAKLEECTSEYDGFTQKSSNFKVEENCILLDSRTAAFEEDTSSSPREMSSVGHELHSGTEVLMKADLDGPTCDYDASENFGGLEYDSQVFSKSNDIIADYNMGQNTRINNSENASLADAIFDYSEAEIMQRTDVAEDWIKTEKILHSSLESSKVTGSSSRTSPYQQESEFQSEVECKDNSRMINSLIYSMNVADDGGGDNLDFQDCAGNADHMHLPHNQTEDPGVGINSSGNANSTDQENDSIATSSRSPSAVEKYWPIPGFVVNQEIKEGCMDEINSLLRKMRISSSMKWRGSRACMTPKGLKKSFEDHGQLSMDMKENIVSMKCIKSGNFSEKQSGFKRRALEDLQGSRRREPERLDRQ